MFLPKGRRDSRNGRWSRISENPGGHQERNDVNFYRRCGEQSRRYRPSPRGSGKYSTVVFCATRKFKKKRKENNWRTFLRNQIRWKSRGKKGLDVFNQSTKNTVCWPTFEFSLGIIIENENFFTVGKLFSRIRVVLDMEDFTRNMRSFDSPTDDGLKRWGFVRKKPGISIFQTMTNQA